MEVSQEAGCQTYALHGDALRARAYADSSRQAFDAQLRETPDDAQRHLILGVDLAYLGRRAEAIKEGERGGALLPVSGDAYTFAPLRDSPRFERLIAGG